MQKEIERGQQFLIEDLRETKTTLLENKRRIEDQNIQFNTLSAHVQNEVLNVSKKMLNTNSPKETTVDPKWGETVLKLEENLNFLIKRNQALEAKIDNFLLFQHKSEMNMVIEKCEGLKVEMNILNEKVAKLKLEADSPEKPRSKGDLLTSPIKTESLPIIDDERFNSILEKTKRNIELALSFSFLFPASSLVF